MAAHLSPKALTKAAAASLAVAGMLQLSNAAEAAPKKISQINTFAVPTTLNLKQSSSKYTNKAFQVNAKPSPLVNPSFKTKIKDRIAGKAQLSNAAEAAPKRISQINTFAVPTTLNLKQSSSKYTNKAFKVNAKPSSLANPSIKTKIKDRIQIQDLGRTGWTAGTKLTAPDISRKVINGAGLQEIGRAVQIIGGMERGRGSAIDQAGLHAPSVQMPAGTCGGMLDALDPGAFISSYDRTSGLQGIGRRSRMEGCLSQETKSRLGDGSGSVGQHPPENANGREMVDKITTTSEEWPSSTNYEYTCTSTSVTTYSDGSSTTETEKQSLHSWPDGTQSVLTETCKESKSATGETYTSTVKETYDRETGTREIIETSEEKKDANGKTVDTHISNKSKMNPNPESDGAYGTYDISGKPGALGLLKKLNTNRDRLKNLKPTIDPNRDSDHANGNYTGPSIGGITSSNGGTSTGSWYHPYGKGGYTGPNVDAIGTSHGGTSTGGFKPPF